MKPRNLNKKPVLVVDPEELAREREHLHLVGAQLVGEEDAEPAPAEWSVSPLGLAAATPDDEDYQEYDEQDLPPLGDSFTAPDALLGLSGREEAAEGEASEPAKRVGLDLDALRQAAGLDQDEEENGFTADISSFAVYDFPSLPEEPAKRIGLDLDALGEASGFEPEDEQFEPEDEQEEDALSAEAPDFSAFDAAVPTELPEKRIGLDLDALRKAGGYDEDEEDDYFPVSMPDFSAFRSPAPAEDAGRIEPENAGEEVEDWSDFEDEPVDFAPIRPAAPLRFDPALDPEPESTDEAVTEPQVPDAPERAPEPEPAADTAPRLEPEPLREPDPEPEYAQESEPEPEPEPEPELESPAEPRVSIEPSLLRMTKRLPEAEAEAAAPPPSDERPRFVAGPADPTDEIRQEAPGRAVVPEADETRAAARPEDLQAAPPRPGHCQVRARLLRNEDHAISKPKGMRGWLRSVRLWLKGY